jgi:hypothetical protein
MRRSHPVARVDIRMETARQPPLGALDVADVRLGLDAEDDVEIHRHLHDYRRAGWQD